MWLSEPGFADGFVWCEAVEGLEPATEVVSGDKVGEVLPEVVVAVVMIALAIRCSPCPRHGCASHLP